MAPTITVSEESITAAVEKYCHHQTLICERKRTIPSFRFLFLFLWTCHNDILRRQEIEATLPIQNKLVKTTTQSSTDRPMNHKAIKGHHRRPSETLKDLPNQMMLHKIRQESKMRTPSTKSINQSRSGKRRRRRRKGRWRTPNQRRRNRRRSHGGEKRTRNAEREQRIRLSTRGEKDCYSWGKDTPTSGRPLM